jgi:hypothetical protein
MPGGAFAPITGLDLLMTNLTAFPFETPSITVMGRTWGDRHVTILKAFDDEPEAGLRLLSLGEGGGASGELGYAAGFSLKNFLEGSDASTPEQVIRVKGWHPGTTTNRPPPTAMSLRLASSATGAGVDCSADFSEWGISEVTVQLWDGNILKAERRGVPAQLHTPLVTLGEFPTLVGCPAVGVLSLAHTNPISVLDGLTCPSACEGTELRIIAEWTDAALPPIAFTGLEFVIGDGMEQSIFELVTVPACSPVPLHATVGTGGIVLSWEGAGFRLQGAEQVTGPWHDLAVDSPFIVPGSAKQKARFYRLHCD